MNLEELRNKYKVNVDSLKGDSDEENFNKAEKLAPGKNRVRIVAFDDGSVLEKVDVHMNLGDPFLCPKKHGGGFCPSCDFGWEEYNRNGKVHTKDAKGNDISKNFLSQRKFIFRGVLRSKEESDIKKYGYPRLRWFDMSQTLGDIIIKFCADQEEHGDITDIIEGKDFILEKDEEKAKNRQQSVSASLAGKNTPVITFNVNDPKFVEMFQQMMENAPRLEDRFAIKTADEIREMLAAYKERSKKKSSNEDFSNTSKDFDVAQSSLEDDEFQKMF